MRHVWLTAALLVVPGLAAAQIGGMQGQWTVTIAAGMSIPVGGQFHQEGAGTVLNLPLTIESRSAADVYDAGGAWRAGLGYGISRNTEILVEMAGETTRTSPRSVGDLMGLDVRAEFDRYTAFGVDAGVRSFMSTSGRVRPFASALAGFRRVSAVDARFTAAGVFAVSDTTFYEASLDAPDDARCAGSPLLTPARPAGRARGR